MREILARILPSDVRTHVFGSRAGGRVKPCSDPDLGLEGENRLSLSLLARLAEALDVCALPWKVDLVDLRGVSEGFAGIADATKVPFD